MKLFIKKYTLLIRIKSWNLGVRALKGSLTTTFYFPDWGSIFHRHQNSFRFRDFDGLWLFFFLSAEGSWSETQTGQREDTQALCPGTRQIPAILWMHRSHWCKYFFLRRKFLIHLWYLLSFLCEKEDIQKKIQPSLTQRMRNQTFSHPPQWRLT